MSTSKGMVVDEIQEGDYTETESNIPEMETNSISTKESQQNLESITQESSELNNIAALKSLPSNTNSITSKKENEKENPIINEDILKMETDIKKHISMLQNKLPLNNAPGQDKKRESNNRGSMLFSLRNSINISYNFSRLTNLFSDPKELESAYVKNLIPLKSLIASRKDNIVKLPLQNKIYSVLYQPFSSRPINEEGCRTALSVFEEIIKKFPEPDANTITNQLQFLLNCLLIPYHPIKDLLIEFLSNLFYQGINCQTTRLTDKEVQTIMFSFFHYLSLGVPDEDKPFHKEENRIFEKITSLFHELCTLKNLKNGIHKKVDINEVVSRMLYSTLSVNSFQAQSLALSMISEVPWKDDQKSILKKLPHRFLSSAYVLFLDTARKPSLESLQQTNEIVNLLLNSYPLIKVNKKESKEVKNAKKLCNYYAIGCALLAFSMNIPESQDLEIQKSINRNSHQYLKNCINAGFIKQIIDVFVIIIRDEPVDLSISIYYAFLEDSFTFEHDENFLESTLSVLYDKFYKESHLEITSRLSELLKQLKIKYPIQFYSPVVKLVSTNSVDEASKLVFFLTTLESVVGDQELLFSELDLIMVILFTEVGTSDSDELNPTDAQNMGVKFLPCKLGQIVFLSELILVIYKFRKEGKDLDNIDHINFLKTLVDLEKQVNVFLVAKDKASSSRIHPVIRFFILKLLLEIRLVCEIKKRPIWVKTVSNWTQKEFIFSYKLKNENIILDLKRVYRKHQEVVSIKKKSNYLKVSKQPKMLADSFKIDKDNIVRSPLQSPLTFFSKLAGSPDPGLQYIIQKPTYGSSQNERELLYEIMFKDSLIDLILTHFVISHQTLNETDLVDLMPVFWNYLLDPDLKTRQAKLIFLFLLCGEKNISYIYNFFENDLSDDYLVIYDVYSKISLFFGKRFSICDILNQEDLEMTKVFSKSGPTMQFVGTTIGTYEPVVKESYLLRKLKLSGTSAKEIKMIQSLGWDTNEEDDEENKLWNPDLKILTSNIFLDDLFRHQNSNKPGKTVENEGKDMYSNLKINKKNQILTDLIGRLTIKMNSSFADSFNSEFCYQRTNVYRILRDEPSWFLKFHFSLVHLQSIEELTNTLEILMPILYIKPSIDYYRLERYKNKNEALPEDQNQNVSTLPIQFSYYLFNYLSGFNKMFYKDQRNFDLRVINRSLSIFSKLLNSTHEIGFRELRKNKIEIAFCNDGTFWPSDNLMMKFHPSYYLPGSEYEDLKDRKSFENSTLESMEFLLFQLIQYRMSQFLFMKSLLLKNPFDHYPIQKTLRKFEPVKWYYNNMIENIINQNDNNQEMIDKSKILKDYFHHKVLPNLEDKVFINMSCLHSSAWVKFLDQLFSAIDFGYQDREQLAIILEGVNRIILTHHNEDFNLVSECFHFLVKITFKFRRLFNIKSCYFLIIPSIFKVYYLSTNPQVKNGILYVIALFLNLHRESFIFQMLGSLVPIILDSSEEAHTNNTKIKDKLSLCLFEWIKALEQPPKKDSFNLKLGTNEVLVDKNEGIIGLGETNKKSWTTLLPGNVKPIKKQKSNELLSHEPFSLVNSFKLFITIIAYDPSSTRSEQFIILLQLLLPHFYDYSNELKDLITEAIKALIPIFVNFSKKKWTLSSLWNRDNTNDEEDEININNLNTTSAHITAQTSNFANSHTIGQGFPHSHNDKTSIKLEVIKLTSEYLKLHNNIEYIQYENLIFILKSKIKNPGFSFRSCPITFFVHNILFKLTHTNDSFLSSFMNMIITILPNVIKSSIFIDLYTALGLLMSNPSTQIELKQYASLFLFGLEFINNPPTNIEKSREVKKQISLSLVSFMVPYLQVFPKSGVEKFNEYVKNNKEYINQNIIDWYSLFLIPVIKSINKDDFYFEYVKYLDFKEKEKMREIWIFLLSLCLESVDINSYNLKHSHPRSSKGFIESGRRLNCSRDVILLMLRMIAIKMVSIKAFHLISTDVFDLIHTDINQLLFDIQNNLIIKSAKDDNIEYYFKQIERGDKEVTSSVIKDFLHIHIIYQWVDFMILTQLPLIKHYLNQIVDFIESVITIDFELLVSIITKLYNKNISDIFSSTSHSPSGNSSSNLPKSNDQDTSPNKEFNDIPLIQLDNESEKSNIKDEVKINVDLPTIEIDASSNNTNPVIDSNSQLSDNSSSPKQGFLNQNEKPKPQKKSKKKQPINKVSMESLIYSDAGSVKNINDILPNLLSDILRSAETIDVFLYNLNPFDTAISETKPSEKLLGIDFKRASINESKELIFMPKVPTPSIYSKDDRIDKDFSPSLFSGIESLDYLPQSKFNWHQYESLTSVKQSLISDLMNERDLSALIFSL